MIRVETKSLGCYKLPMVKRGKDKRDVTWGVVTTQSIKDLGQYLADQDDRSLSNMGELLVIRGLVAYRRDGLFRDVNAEQIVGEMVEEMRAAQAEEAPEAHTNTTHTSAKSPAEANKKRA